jgi:hypothetical protein
MQVKVATGQAWMRGHFGQSTSIKTLPIAAAHATLARKDIVVLRADFVDNEIEVDVITGTAAASPVAPSTTQNTSVWETLLAIVDVPAAAVTITSGNVVDYRVYTTAFAKFSRSTTQSIGSGAFTKVSFNVIDTRAGDIQGNSGLTDFTLLRPGLWQITAQLGWATAGGHRSMRIQTSGAEVVAESAVSDGSSINIYLNATASERWAVNTTFSVYAWQNSGGNVNLLAGTPKLSCMWVGP